MQTTVQVCATSPGRTSWLLGSSLNILEATLPKATPLYLKWVYALPETHMHLHKPKCRVASGLADNKEARTHFLKETTSERKRRSTVPSDVQYFWRQISVTEALSAIPKCCRGLEKYIVTFYWMDVHIEVLMCVHEALYSAWLTKHSMTSWALTRSNYPTSN
jgi:hypothetical protein